MLIDFFLAFLHLRPGALKEFASSTAHIQAAQVIEMSLQSQYGQV